MFKIIWSEDAISDYIDTVEFWQNHNKSSNFSLKIIENVEVSENKICENPLIGLPTKYKNTYRFLFLKNFALYYRISEREKLVEILEFWDGRRNPENLSL